MQGLKALCILLLLWVTGYVRILVHTRKWPVSIPHQPGRIKVAHCWLSKFPKAHRDSIIVLARSRIQTRIAERVQIENLFLMMGFLPFEFQAESIAGVCFGVVILLNSCQSLVFLFNFQSLKFPTFSSKFRYRLMTVHANPLCYSICIRWPIKHKRIHRPGNLASHLGGLVSSFNGSMYPVLHVSYWNMCQVLGKLAQWRRQLRQLFPGHVLKPRSLATFYPAMPCFKDFWVLEGHKSLRLLGKIFCLHYMEYCNEFLSAPHHSISWWCLV